MVADASVRARAQVHPAGDDRAGDGKPDRPRAVRALPAREARATAILSVAATSQPLERLKSALAETADLKHAEPILDWDSRVSMPHAGALARADATATLSRRGHGRVGAAEVGARPRQAGPLER